MKITSTLVSCLMLSVALAAEQPMPTPVLAPLPKPGQAAAQAVSPPAKPKVFAHVAGVETDESIDVQDSYMAWPHINLKEAQRLHAQKHVVFADARAKVEWDQAHIPGALPVPLGEFDKYYKERQKKFERASIIVVYCHGVGCHLSDMACQKFREKGHKNVVNFYGGWPDWSGAKLPQENREGKPPLPTPTPSPAK